MRKKCIVIVGPTGVGKTRLSIFLAKRLNSEIISADSMQIYKYMDIGTAKVEPKYQKEIKHHLIDIVEPNENFNVEQFQSLCIDKIEEISAKNKIPIIVGGTGLYINSITHKLEFNTVKSDEKLRYELENIAESQGNQKLHKMLEDIDPESASKIHKNNVRRVIRAIEVYKLTGHKFSEINDKFDHYNDDYDFYIIGLNDDREILYKRINQRVDEMIDEGFMAECKYIYELTDENSQSIQAIGYREAFMYLNNEISFKDMVSLMKKNSRKYAKRQLTWFRQDERIHWMNLEDFNKFEDIEKNCLENVKEWLYDKR
ncbi:MAG: tRNA (adenosine(37)-N6)-dimethylallyltransferase MiaA [Finegoldia magna]|uniref:tRNA (adenosine(37)-N6)-dimethylallyltransferase MiaA n=1 Tax=Finegoldia magna TaxID=1260 RepID=UPI000B915EC9|nr:tRNA (adenosine(37)-N6)-dimethylallyltransferase MiaA [Finegoldia magna]MDU1009996.1 tRNA (adenosine(37)-N6)-dimethylallyltransferase MiaA [Finegoldia magna]MDU1087029.1 tRNA (adenosine(37)-N6)-dimethylallyltransferase MiaA [Finegoldia magna]MDU7889662.1 tRNA (adenosine(37)-N6)-dimethylallyltransferase MiaA [Finegoldia magna]MDU7925648.1 tRNA (adenosine(37)-N6)-dimethylallyltransferase MiaA [Finegoldia magna]OXZ38648.1 tRNA (adenosine(37)-N6)-dimethylallyltransferase MiaA [Finegoldia magna]